MEQNTSTRLSFSINAESWEIKLSKRTSKDIACPEIGIFSTASEYQNPQISKTQKMIFSIYLVSKNAKILTFRFSLKIYIEVVDLSGTD